MKRAVVLTGLLTGISMVAFAAPAVCPTCADTEKRSAASTSWWPTQRPLPNPIGKLCCSPACGRQTVWGCCEKRSARRLTT